jgi:hypothetical protein
MTSAETTGASFFFERSRVSLTSGSTLGALGSVLPPSRERARSKYS